MERKELKYPIGIQSFEKLRERGFLYIDKTEYVYNMTHSNASYVFLARPRRFGKSLLVSTLKAYFEGRKELFEGLAIEKLETEWEQHPVLLFSLASAKFDNKEDLESELNLKLSKYEKVWGSDPNEVRPNQRLQGLIERAYEKTGKGVVLLIDEYDAPLLDVTHDETKLKEIRKVVQNFYSPIKDCDDYLHFVFITGITKYSQVSIFSELNNLEKISMLEEYGNICGITEKEMLTQLDAGIQELADKQKITKEDAIKALKENYDGYHFTWPSEDVFNPFSLLQALKYKKLDYNWFESGTPSYLIPMLAKFNLEPANICDSYEAFESDFDTPVQGMTSIIPLLYQSGYLTIKDYQPETGLYKLDLPNKEVRIGLLNSLLPNYLDTFSTRTSETIGKMWAALKKDDINAMLTLLQAFLKTIPYAEYVDQPEHFEAHWQRMLTIILSLLGAEVDVEVKAHIGRIDMVARTAQKLYLFELKLNKTACAAMDQIDLKDYPSRFALCNLPVAKVGVNFNEEMRNITDWEIKDSPNGATQL